MDVGDRSARPELTYCWCCFLVVFLPVECPTRVGGLVLDAGVGLLRPTYQRDLRVDVESGSGSWIDMFGDLCLPPWTLQIFSLACGLSRALAFPFTFTL